LGEPRAIIIDNYQYFYIDTAVEAV